MTRRPPNSIPPISAISGALVAIVGGLVAVAAASDVDTGIVLGLVIGLVFLIIAIGVVIGLMVRTNRGPRR
jgi:hypothetical protein